MLSAAHDPAVWIVGVVGAVLSLILAGIGSGLALMCATYDRQTTPLSTGSGRASSTSGATTTTSTPPASLESPPPGPGHSDVI